jgi:zinc transport system substrate-binding protein
MLVVVASITVGCARASGTHGRVEVVASFYPLAFIAQRVGGDRVAVRNLTAPGSEPHDLELTPGQIEAVHRADLTLYLGNGFQPAVEKAVSSSPHALDALSAARPLIASAVDRAAHDPHVWLDPSRMAKIVGAISAKLASVDASGADEYRQRAVALASDIADLGRVYATGLSSCRRREIVTSHAAFGYLASRYRLRQIPIAGLDPEAEPTPRRLADVVTLVRRYHATTVFYEELVSPKIAQTVAREARVRTDVLDPIEGVKGSDTYITAMRRNLDHLRRALECS